MRIENTKTKFENYIKIPQSPFPKRQPARRVGVRRTNPQSRDSSTQNCKIWLGEQPLNPDLALRARFSSFHNKSFPLHAPPSHSYYLTKLADYIIQRVVARTRFPLVGANRLDPRCWTETGRLFHCKKTIATALSTWLGGLFSLLLGLSRTHLPFPFRSPVWHLMQ